MRIIAGKYKAKRLVSPKTEKTRPTLDRVKEAIFSMIDAYIEDSEFLDLFSGTGNIGIEAISRGAKFCLMNDGNKKAISTIIENVNLTKCKDCVKISLKDYMKCLKNLHNNNCLFDVVFLDPPYNSDCAFKSMKYISENCCILKPNGIIVYETDKYNLDEKCDSFDNLECVNTKHYSNVIIKLYKWRNN